MPAGRPPLADAGTLYAFAHQLYWDLRRLAEGGQRQWFDRASYERLEQAITSRSLEPTRKQNRAMQAVVEEEIRSGRLAPTQRQAWLKQSRASHRQVNRVVRARAVAVAATSIKTIPGEPEVLNALLSAETPEEVREICQDAYVTSQMEVEPGVFREVHAPNWPLPHGSVLPLYLSRHAEAFVAAKQNDRYPRSDRESSRLKQLWFLARALAGAIYDVRARTAINLVGSTRPEEIFESSHAARPRRRQTKRRI